VTNRRYTRAIQIGIEREIATMRNQIQDALATQEAQPTSGDRRLPSGSTAPSVVRPAEEIITALDTRIARLEQVRDWIGEDQQFSSLIDDVIGKQVQAAMRRQRIFNTLLNVGFLMAGWLLSLVGSPAAIAALFPR
jgi:hypothetical protein